MRRILDGTYPPHHQMPSESELGAMFKVSCMTVRPALGDLQKEGLIYTQSKDALRGRGAGRNK